jgi:hypothetical protein
MTPVYLIDITPPEALGRLKERTIKLLKETKIYKHAFVVYEIPKLLYNGGETTETTGIVAINVEDQPAQEYNLNDLLNRGGKYCCHYNFPTHDNSNPSRVDKYKLYHDPSAGNPWDRLTVHCLRQIGHANEISSESRKYKEALIEIEKLKQEVESSKKEKDDERKSTTRGAKGITEHNPEAASELSK